MSRREYSYRPECIHEGCVERALYVFSTLREKRDTMESLRRRGGWRCIRHTEPDEMLSTETPERRQVLVCREESHGRFWGREGSARLESGFAHGPGFKVFAGDFPAGTRLIVIARIEVPS